MDIADIPPIAAAHECRTKLLSEAAYLL